MAIGFASRPRSREGADTVEAAPTTEHRILTVIAAVSLLFAAGPFWAALVVSNPVRGTLFGPVFPLLLVASAVALGARRRRTLVRVDVVLIAAALVRLAFSVVPVLQRPRYVVDESVIMARAIAAVASGANPYAGDWSAEVANAPTLLFDGTNPGRFGYPPLSVLFGGALAKVVGTTRAPVVATVLATLLVVVVLWRVLPTNRRVLIVPAVVTLSALPFLATSGYPTALMIPLLLVACHRPARIGAGGRLGRRGAVQAVALGLAVATQQLAWFVAPFLLVAVWRSRRGELDRRPAALVTLRVLGVAAASFALVNAPFVLTSPRLWARGITDPLLQHAMFNGPGLPNLTLRIVGGGGQLAYWSAAAAVVFLTLLLASALWPRQLGAGLMVLPFVALWTSLRAQTIYYDLAFALVFAAVGVGSSAADFDRARPLRLGRLPRVVAPAIGAVVVLALVVAALVTPAPLTVRVRDVQVNAAAQVRSITLQVRNHSDHDVTPHVTVDSKAKFSPFLRRVSGPARLRPGQSATLVLVPSTSRPMPRPRVVYVVSDDPQTLSSVRVNRRDLRG